ncbi:MAG: family 78 glycoside hydrolase catalytic domain [Lachnospiraceae bacterium]|nr:family 78 glycoside hydrolase catalytic domain [Lachnospiraceae bacterium]
MKAVRLQTEYLNNPLGIDMAHPRMLWNCEGGVRQTAYRIVTDKWDSGKVESSSMHADYPQELLSRERVNWKICLWDEENEQGEWSEAFFETGLLKENDWTSQWITGDYAPSKKKRYPADCFRKYFEAPKSLKARLYISACGLYEAYINGQRVGDFVLAPGSTDYRKRVQYQTYDVTDLLRPGKNELTLVLADGWYRGSIGAKGATCVFGKQTAVKAQLEIIDSEGHVTVVATDETFEWSNDGNIRFADLKDGEIVDLNSQPTYSGFAKTCNKAVPMTSGNNTFVREQESFAPVRSFKTPTGKLIYEFPQNLAGILAFKVEARKGDRVDIRLGEMLDVNGELTLKNIQCVRKGKATPLQEIHLVCKDGLNEYHGRFTISGFKYAEVSISASEPLELTDLKQIALYSDLPETGSFSCDNELINTFVDNTVRSLKSNSADVPTDCPTRERMGWTGDSQVFFNTAAFLTEYAAFARKHLRDIYDRQDKNGRLPQIAPYNAEDWFMNVMNGSVGWADAGVLIPYRFYLRYGDDRLLRQYYSDMVRYAKFMIRRCGGAKGIYAIYAKPLHLSKKNRKYGVNTGQSYGEWAEPADVKSFVWTDFCRPNPEESMAYTSYILSLMAEISEIVGDTKDKALFEEYSEGVKAAYRELVTKPDHTLDTDRQAKLVRPLYMNLLTEEQAGFARKRLIQALDNYGWRVGTGFLSTPFILDVLTSIDVEACYRLLENEEKPGWLYMAKHSTGTVWEDWDGPEGAQSGIASLNHYSKGAVVEWLFKGMAGIDIAGENRFRIAPVIGGKETHVKCSYSSVYGTVSSQWRREGDRVSFSLSIPVNTTAEFVYNGTVKVFPPGNYEFEV